MTISHFSWPSFTFLFIPFDHLIRFDNPFLFIPFDLFIPFELFVSFFSMKLLVSFHSLCLSVSLILLLLLTYISSLTSLHIHTARILAALGKNEAACGVYHDLLSQNQDSSKYLELLKQCSGKVDAAFYTDLISLYPRSKMIRMAQLVDSSPGIIPLFLFDNPSACIESFPQLFQDFVKPELLKGVPSLFVLLRDLYADDSRVPVIEATFLAYHDSLTSSKPCFPGDSAVAPPSAYLWVVYFLAQHFDHLGAHERALDWIRLAITHTPTLTEAYMLHAKILKHAGAYAEAMRVMDDARHMDLQDRFVNTKCVKYLLRCGEHAKAREVVGLFTKV